MNIEIKDHYHETPLMTPRDLACFEKLLNDALNDLQHQAGYAMSELTQEQSRETELIDSAMVHINQSLNFRLHTRKSHLIKKIKDALKRIEDGSYGYCEICGEPISLKRLSARLVTSKCLACKEAEERLEALVS
nr:TraR/DksA C4-type zinc finger protein [uncultured Desulfobacter sp.]